MKHGDISNVPAPTIVVNFENVVLKDWRNTPLRRLKWVANQQNCATLNEWFFTDCRIILATFHFRERHLTKIDTFLEENGVLYSGIKSVKDISELERFIKAVHGGVYFDTDKERVAMLVSGRMWGALLT